MKMTIATATDSLRGFDKMRANNVMLISILCRLRNPGVWVRLENEENVVVIVV